MLRSKKSKIYVNTDISPKCLPGIMNPIAYASLRSIDILSAVGGRMKSGLHKINQTSKNLIKIYMKSIIKIFDDNIPY